MDDNKGGRVLARPARQAEGFLPSISFQSDIAGAREVLAERFPNAFMRKGEPKKKPLKLGIQHDVIARLPEIPAELIKRAVSDYTTGPKYARAMIAGVQRVDLEGKPAGEVTADAEMYTKSREARRREKSQRHFRELEMKKTVKS